MNAHPNIPPKQWTHILSELRGIETREDDLFRAIIAAVK